jgi:hypothetical protein
MATLIVLAVLLPDAAATNIADTATTMATPRATARVLRLRTLPDRACCMANASSERMTVGSSSPPGDD